MLGWMLPYGPTYARHVLAPEPRPAVPESARIRVGENGYIHGVDGMLDQVGSALMKHAGPMIVRDVLPAVRADPALQTRVGQAVGEAAASELAPWVALGAGALAIMAFVSVMRWRVGR